MIISETSLLNLLVLPALTASLANTGPKLPPLHPKFHAHLNCPYANQWLTKGPEQAAIDLGLGRNLIPNQQNSNRRALEETIMGRCTFTNPFSGDSCTEFRGAGWTTEAMTERCSQESSGSFTGGEACASDENTAGYCVKSVADDTNEYNLMAISSMADCGGNKMACETFVRGSFIAAAACDDSNSTMQGTDDNGVGTDFDFSVTESSEPTSCGIAPGAIGAAHQNAFSSGYSESGCPGTPAEGSPYMWPLKWAADYETQNMAFGDDEVVFKSMGRTFYRLDKNWKRSDTTYQLGELRTIGQGPCNDVDEIWEEQGLMACSKNQTDGTMTTMIHRGNMMYFVSWKNDTVVETGDTDATKIEDCSSINLQVVGNIRPDWFLDARGDDTDVQYLGNQHVFYSENMPKLVKQWRKKDFASQYFTMSMMENHARKVNQNGTETVSSPEDLIKWPLILNIPGEGFGDDMLQRYSNHALLTDEEDDLFMLIENFEKIGGTCVDVGSGEGAGPPILDVHIPSNLEIDPNAWFSNEYTFSPYWTPAIADSNSSISGTNSAPPSNRTVTQVSDRVTVESCWDDSTNSVDLSLHYFDVEVTTAGTLPWIALGFRSSDVCAMTPPEGGYTPMILITHSSVDSAPIAHSGELVPEAKGMSQEAFGTIYQSLVPLDETVGYSDVSVNAPMVNFASEKYSIADEDTVTLSFKQVMDQTPDVMYFTYAIGATSQLGVHITRACFELTDFTSCSSSSSEGGVSVVSMIDEKVSTKSDGETSEAKDLTAGSSLLFASIAVIMALF